MICLQKKKRKWRLPKKKKKGLLINFKFVFLLILFFFLVLMINERVKKNVLELWYRVLDVVNQESYYSCSSKQRPKKSKSWNRSVWVSVKENSHFDFSKLLTFVKASWYWSQSYEETVILNLAFLVKFDFWNLRFSWIKKQSFIVCSKNFFSIVI